MHSTAALSSGTGRCSVHTRHSQFTTLHRYITLYIRWERVQWIRMNWLVIACTIARIKVLPYSAPHVIVTMSAMSVCACPSASLCPTSSLETQTGTWKQEGGWRSAAVAMAVACGPGAAFGGFRITSGSGSAFHFPVAVLPTSCLCIECCPVELAASASLAAQVACRDRAPRPPHGRGPPPAWVRRGFTLLNHPLPATNEQEWVPSTTKIEDEVAIFATLPKCL